MLPVCYLYVNIIYIFIYIYRSVFIFLSLSLSLITYTLYMCICAPKNPQIIGGHGFSVGSTSQRQSQPGAAQDFARLGQVQPPSNRGIQGYQVIEVPRKCMAVWF